MARKTKRRHKKRGKKKSKINTSPCRTAQPPAMPTTPFITPPSGIGHKIIFHLNPPNGENKFQITELDYHKDLEDHTGGGQLTIPLDHDTYNKFKINNTFELKWAWDGMDPVTVMTGFISHISRKGNYLEIEFKDKGALLEKKEYLVYRNMRRSAIICDIIRKAGLNPIMNWAGTNADDITSYTDDSGEKDKPPKSKKKKKKKKKKGGSNIGAPRPW